MTDRPTSPAHVPAEGLSAMTRHGGLMKSQNTDANPNPYSVTVQMLYLARRCLVNTVMNAKQTAPRMPIPSAPAGSPIAASNPPTAQ